MDNSRQSGIIELGLRAFDSVQAGQYRYRPEWTRLRYIDAWNKLLGLGLEVGDHTPWLDETY